MANTFKVVSHDVMPASSGTPEALYTTPGSTTTIILGLVIANIHFHLVHRYLVEEYFLATQKEVM